MTALVIFLISVTGLYFVSNWIGGPSVHKNVNRNDLEKFFAPLLGPTTTTGSVITIEEGGRRTIAQLLRRRRFVQFLKRENAKGSPYLEFGFPDAPWSREYWTPMREALSLKFPIEIISTPDRLVRRFLIVRPLSSLEEAQEAAELSLAVIGLTDGPLRAVLKFGLNYTAAKAELNEKIAKAKAKGG